ncbi:Importin subunit alpha-2-like protein [Aphelenchoides bicaudatus]|nr:Importin subunit alpha-2-like protein [Aphelenchoides bicaudatus]
MGNAESTSIKSGDEHANSFEVVSDEDGALLIQKCNDSIEECEKGFQKLELTEAPKKKSPKSKSPKSISSSCKHLVSIFEISQERQLDTVRTIRKTLAKQVENSEVIDEVIQSGILPIIVNGLTYYKNPDLQYESLWILLNITAGSVEQTRVVVELGAIPVLIKYVDPSNLKLTENAIWSLANIAHDEPEKCLKTYESSKPLVFRLLDLLDSNDADTFELSLLNCIYDLTTRLLAHLRKRTSGPLPTQLISVLIKLIQNPKTDVKLLDTLLSYLMFLCSGDRNKEYIRMIVVSSTERCKLFVDLLTHENKDIQEGVLKITGNVVAGSNDQTNKLLNQGLFPILVTLMNNQLDVKNKALVVRCLSNIAAGGCKEVQMILSSKAMEPFIAALNSKEDPDLTVECLWTISNLLECATNEQLAELLEYDIMQAIYNALVTNPPADHSCVASLKSVMKSMFDEASSLMDGKLSEMKLRNLKKVCW